jgi:hypothetical protein
MFKKIILAAALAVSAVFAQIDVSAHAAFSYGTISGKGMDDMDWGAGFIVGPEVKYSFNPMVALVTGLELDYRRASYDYFVEYDRYLDPDLRNYTVTETMSFMYLDIPLLLRVSPVPFFFIDAGMTFGFNLSATYAMEYDGGSSSDDVSASMKTFEYGLVCGLGFTVFTDLEFNFRAAFGMTSMSKNTDEFKNMRLQFGITYWSF